MPRGLNPLYVGTNRFVAALDPQTGEELWRTKLPRGQGSLVTIVIKGQHLYAGCYGHVYCLDKRTGAVLWENGLPKMSYYTVLLAMEGADGTTARDGAAAEAYRQKQKRAAAGAAGATAAT